MAQVFFLSKVCFEYDFFLEVLLSLKSSSVFAMSLELVCASLSCALLIRMETIFMKKFLFVPMSVSSFSALKQAFLIFSIFYLLSIQYSFYYLYLYSFLYSYLYSFWHLDYVNVYFYISNLNSYFVGGQLFKDMHRYHIMYILYFLVDTELPCAF